MITGILVTDGGPHSATKWAEASSSHIVSIAEGISGPKQESAIRLQAAVLGVLTKGHTLVQAGERARIGTDPSIINSALSASDHVSVPDLVNEIVAAGVGTPWEADMATDEFMGQLTLVLTSHLHTSMHIERSWHADRNPGSPHAQTFRATHNVGA